ncbi:MAG: tetratricopeptide repeat protein [Nitriliruptorales bacterium]|nr:tetratricopeptide repeat protein [Nitriliruptorales bacterium]
MEVDELNERVEEALAAPDLAHAAQLLDRTAADEVAEDDQPDVVALWEDLADAYADRGRHDQAIAAIKRCLAMDYATDHDVRGTLAGYLLRAGREGEADELWEVVAGERPEEVTLRFMAGVAYQDLERHEDALGWFDEALEMVLAHGDREGWLGDLLEARDEARSETGRQPDDLQLRGESLLAQQLRHVRASDPSADRRSRAAERVVSWFPPEEWGRAADEWPHVRDGAADKKCCGTVSS